MDGPSWTLGKWILSSFVLIVWIALGNYLFVNWLMDWRAMGYFSFLRMIGYTSLIGVFPVALSGILIQLRETQKNEESASDISENLKSSVEANHLVVTLEPENGAELRIDASNLRFVEAMQNYVTVWFVLNGDLQKEVLRTTLTATEKQLENTDVIRCHRSYLVNVDCIENVSGNAQGLKLKLRDVTDVEVPVSRSFIPAVRAFLD
jgi:DNA-binding LytR/AlgR family response regulator